MLTKRYSQQDARNSSIIHPQHAQFFHVEPIFRRLFGSNFKEKDAAKIKLNCDRPRGAVAFKNLLEFIYTDNVKAFDEPPKSKPVDEEHSSSSAGVAASAAAEAEKPIEEEPDASLDGKGGRDEQANADLDTVNLYCIAEEYLLPRLKRMCEEQLKKELTADKAPMILYQTDVYGAKDLREHCFSVIIEQSDKILNGDEVKQLPAHLVLELAKRFADIARRSSSCKRPSSPREVKRPSRRRRVHFTDST